MYNLMVKNYNALLPFLQSNILSDQYMYDWMIGMVINFTNHECPNVPKVSKKYTCLELMDILVK